MPSLSLKNLLKLERKGLIKFTQARKVEFLELLTANGLPTHCAHRVGVTMQTIRDHRKKDELFGGAYNEAMDTYRDTITKEVARRGLFGVKRDVYFQGKVVGQENVYSDKMLEMLAKRYIPEFRDTLVADLTVSGGVLVVGAASTPAEWAEAFGGPQTKRVTNEAAPANEQSSPSSGP